MVYYKVVLSGENIFFENDANAPEPIIGFITCKLIKAETEELAVARAKRDLLVHWNHSFNADRKLGVPKLAVEFVQPVRGWFKPKMSNDYYWFTDIAHKQEQYLKLVQPPSGWFWRKHKKDSMPPPTIG